MKHLTKKSYWDENQYNAEASSGFLGKIIPRSFYDIDTQRVLRKYLKKDMKMLEIGVAPGLNMLSIAKEFGVRPYGCDYSENGVLKTKENFKHAGYDPRNVFQGDLFNKKFRDKYKRKFDVVSSWGFIEHYDDPIKVVELHTGFSKPKGLFIITVPNITGFNRLLCENIKDMVRFKTATKEGLIASMPSNIKILKVEYFGGIINFGLFFSKNKFLEILRLGLYITQRCTIDQIQRLLLKIGITLKCRYTTPGIMLIGVLNDKN